MIEAPTKIVNQTRVLFLDIDGVLNCESLLGRMQHAFTQHILTMPGIPFSSSSRFVKRGNPVHLFNFPDDRHAAPNMVIDAYTYTALIDLMNEVDAYIVVSSTWRFTMGDAIRDFIGRSGRLHNEWRTVQLASGFRGDEVQAWLSDHPEVTQYAIVDDDSDFTEEQKRRLVQTKFESMGGLHSKHIPLLRDLLTR